MLSVALERSKLGLRANSMTKSTTILISLWLVAATAASAWGDGSTAPADRQERIDFEAALIALRSGDDILALTLFEALVGKAWEGPERRVYAALAARADGRAADSERLVREALDTLSSDQYTYPWVRDELIRLAAEQLLDRQRAEKDAELRALLASHYEARGGLDRLLSLDDMVVRGRLLVGQRQVPFRVLRKRRAFYRFDLYLPGGARIEATDGQVAWRVDPAVNQGEVVILGTAESSPLIHQAVFDDVLVRFRDTAEQVVLAARETLEDDEPHRLEVQTMARERQSIYLDATTLLEVKRVVRRLPEGFPVETISEHLEVDGMPLPARQIVRRSPTSQVEYVFDEYSFGRPLDPSVFGPPNAARGEGL